MPQKVVVAVAAKVVSGCKTGFGTQSGSLLQLRALMGESRPNVR